MRLLSVSNLNIVVNYNLLTEPSLFYLHVKPEVNGDLKVRKFIFI